MSSPDRFDASYYDRYYGEGRAVHSAREVAHLASGVFGLSRWLGVEIASVLDVGAGVGLWRRWLRRRHPRVRYRSIEVSDHAARRYGHERRDISRWRARERFDLVVCHGVLPYLDDAGAARAIENLGRMCRGAMYLEAITRRDLAHAVDREATDTAVHARTGAWYRRRLARHFVQVGGGLWVSRRSGVALYELEAPARSAPRPRRGR
jgi:2-polyprenyl-3-methyl-5-hydroxy-6-metoxy-1,4-benzoquinol methylase